MSTAAGEMLTGEDPGGADAVVAGSSGIAARSPLQLFWRRLRKDKVAMVALAFVAFSVIVALFAPLIVKVAGVPGPNVQNSDLLDSFGLPSGPSGANPLGVDERGRDVFARVVYGARVSLLVAFVATTFATIIGVVVGLLAGFFRGWIDTLLTRAMDVMLAFPVLLLAIGIGVACAGAEGCAGGLIEPGLTVVIFVIAISTWPYMARIVRGQVLSLREKEFVEASTSLGASKLRIIFREILPNLVAPIIVYATILIPQNILFEAALSI
ncbi:MAG: ABC transporter, permease protein 2 (cluster 5, nickel/peptides/opines), partial [uncultured Solirubrobacteraceae bacterium]